MPSDPAPFTPVVPLCEPCFGGREREYVDECLRSGWVSSVGPFVNRFEAMFAERLQTPEAVAVATGTAALHLALLAVGVNPGDEVLVSSLTFIAPANAVRYVGAIPIFIDAEPDFWQMDPAGVREFLENGCKRTELGLVNRKTGHRVSAIVPVHILGHPVDMDAILELARKYDLKVVEDATESLGGSCRGRAVGTMGDVGCFSFNGNKLITTGGGGMVITGSAASSRDRSILAKVRHLSTQAKEPGNEYIHDEVGYNYRLTNLQAAMGCAQLEQLDSFLEKKRKIAAIYAKGFEGAFGVTLMQEAPWARSALWLNTILVEEKAAGIVAGSSRPRSRELIARLSAGGITARPLWQPMNQSPAHLQGEGKHADCPVSGRLFREGVSLPSSVGLSESDQERVIGRVLDFVS